MKHRTYLALAVCILLILSACAGPAAPEEQRPAHFAVGVIRTNGSVNRSSILYFDEDLGQTGITHYPYATMGQSFYSPVVFDGALYLAPQGQANKKDARIVLRQDLDTLELQTYPLDQIAIYGLSADASAIYAANNINGQSFISRIDRADQTVKTAVYDGRYVSLVYRYRDTLYAFSSQSTASGIRGTLHRLDPATLEELGCVDISLLGHDVYSAAGVGDTLYFVPAEAPQGTFSRVVGACHLSTGGLSAVAFPQEVFHILHAGDALYVTHGNLVTGEGTALSVYEPDTGGIRTCDLGLWPQQIAVRGGSLYVMGADRVARFDARTLEKLGEAAIPLEEGDYLAGLFSREPAPRA